MTKIRYEYQEDKYGQCHRAVCSCGMKSNWQQTRDTANYTLYQNHQSNKGCIKQWKERY